MFQTLKTCCEKVFGLTLHIFKFRKPKKVRALAHLMKRKSGEVTRKATVIVLGKSEQTNPNSYYNEFYLNFGKLKVVWKFYCASYVIILCRIPY